MKYLLVYNPHAGNGRAAALLPTLRDYLSSIHLPVELVQTEYPGHASEIAAAADLSLYQGVIASGGDGTLFEVVNGWQRNPASAKPPLGLIPNGTGNAFMKELGLARDDWKKAIEIIRSGCTKQLDLGELNAAGTQHYFLNMVGMGFVSTVAKAAIPLKWLGNAAYTVATLLKLIRLKPQTIWLNIDGKAIERQGIFVEVANSRYTGTSFLMAPKARLDDGMLDVILLNSISRIKLLRLFTSIYDGSHINYPEVEYFQCRTVSIREEKPDALIPDGEIIEAGECHFRVLPKAIGFFWPDVVEGHA